MAGADDTGKAAGTRGRGRPGEGRHVVQVRMGADELAIVDGRARDAGRTRSAFLRAAALSGGPVLSESELNRLWDLRNQLVHVGRNLNQLVRALNAGDDRIADRLRQVDETLAALGPQRRELERIIRQLRDGAVAHATPGGRE